MPTLVPGGGRISLALDDGNFVMHSGYWRLALLYPDGVWIASKVTRPLHFVLGSKTQTNSSLKKLRECVLCIAGLRIIKSNDEG